MTMASDGEVEPTLTPRSRSAELNNMSKDEIKAHLLSESRKRVLAGISAGRRRSINDVASPIRKEPAAPVRTSEEELSFEGGDDLLSPNRNSVQGAEQPQA